MDRRVDAHLRAGAAVFEAGYYHAAHDAWEALWLEMEEGTTDEYLLHGLIQYTAVVHHGRNQNWTGARGLAESAREYLSELESPYRGVELSPIRSYLRRVAADPEHGERTEPPEVVVDGDIPRLEELDLEASFVAAPVLAEALGYEEDALEAAVEYAREDLSAGEDDSRFLTLVLDFVHTAEHRETILHRLEALVDRRQTREDDVAGLF